MGTDAVAPATRLRRLRETFGYELRDADLLERACTHASRCGAQSTALERHQRANERMEFLGDAMLGAALCLLLFQRHPDANEGALSRRKAQLASRATLARLFDTLALDDICLIGDLGNPWPDSVKANLMEGILGGIFLDSDFDHVIRAVAQCYGSRLDDAVGSSPEDAKTALQEWSLAHHQSLPTYRCERSGGPDHEPEFTAVASIAGHEASGVGSSRRRAEAVAAAALLVIIEQATATDDSAPAPSA